MKFKLIGLLCIVFLFIGCRKNRNHCRDCITFNHNGEQRQYLIHTPSPLAANAPLIFVLHGYTGNAPDIKEIIGLDELASSQNFAVCYPQGALDNDNYPHWNARLSISSTDDIGFLSALAKHLQTEYNLDSNRTYTCGFSNGGFMSYTLVAETPEIFKGAASITGTMSGYTWENRDQISPVSILQVTGSQDDVVPMDGSMSEWDGWGGAPHMDTIIQFWKDLNQISTINTSNSTNQLDAFHFEEGIDSTKVWYYKFHNMGHEIPMTNSYGVSSAELLWDFFSSL